MEKIILNLLEMLKSCTSEDFSGAVQRYIDHVKLDPNLGPGKGWLILASNGQQFLIEVSSQSPRGDQLLTFVHEVFHLPFILRGILDIEDQQLNLLLEEGIDDAAEIFVKHHEELVAKLYDELHS